MKHYIRKGRRFVQIEDQTGKFYNDDGTFSVERQENSIGVCFKQTQEKRFIVELQVTKEISWNDAQANVTSNRYLPDMEQAVLICNTLHKLKSRFLICKDFYYVHWWTSSEYNSHVAWHWNWGNSASFAFFRPDSKDYASQYCGAQYVFELPLV